MPHRLNAEERKIYDMAKKKGFLSISGSGYRRERKGSPLANIWRQWCDAKALPCLLLAKGADGDDSVLVDLSTLRVPDVRQVGVHRAWWRVDCCTHCTSCCPASLANSAVGCFAA